MRAERLAASEPPIVSSAGDTSRSGLAPSSRVARRLIHRATPSRRVLSARARVDGRADVWSPRRDDDDESYVRLDESAERGGDLLTAAPLRGMCKVDHALRARRRHERDPEVLRAHGGVNDRGARGDYASDWWRVHCYPVPGVYSAEASFLFSVCWFLLSVSVVFCFCCFLVSVLCFLFLSAPLPASRPPRSSVMSC